MGTPENALYSTPTIYEPLPELSSPTPHGAVMLHEDAWRQLEFVALSESRVLAAELERVAEHIERARQGPGFSRVYLRSEPRSPLGALALEPAGVFEALRCPAFARRPLAVESAAFGGGVVGGFAFAGPSVTLYGNFRDRVALAIGLLMGHEHPPSDEERQALLRLASRYQLCLVDWCAAQAYRSEGEQFQPFSP